MSNRPQRHPRRLRGRRGHPEARTDNRPRVLACTLTPGTCYADACRYADADGYVLGRLAIADDGRPLDWLRRCDRAVTSNAGRPFLWLDLFAN